MQRKRKPELILQDQIIASLNTIPGVVAEKNVIVATKVGDRFIRAGQKGKLDVSVYFKGGAYAEFEVKMPGREKNTSEEQNERIRWLASMGIPTGVWSTVSAAVDTTLRLRKHMIVVFEKGAA